MKVAFLAPGFAVAGQVTAEELGAAAAAGFRTVVNNRPDGEEAGQPSSAEIAAEARRLGLACHDIPVAPGGLAAEDARRLAEAVASSDGPVLAFCRSGTRSAFLWALSEAGRRPAADVAAAATAAGYDLAPLMPYLRARDPSGGADPG